MAKSSSFDSFLSHDSHDYSLAVLKAFVKIINIIIGRCSNPEKTQLNAMSTFAFFDSLVQKAGNSDTFNLSYFALLAHVNDWWNVKEKILG